MIWKRDISVLESKIDILKSYISQFNSISVLNSIATIFNTSENLIESTGLHSPYKLYFYLIGLLFSTKSIENNSFNEEHNNIVKKNLDEIEKLYVRMFFKHKNERNRDMPESWYLNREISMPAFMQYFSEAELASDESLIERINKYYIPYNDIIYGRCNFYITDALELYYKFKNDINKRFSNLVKLRKEAEAIKNDVINKIPIRKFTPENVQRKMRLNGGYEIFEKLFTEIDEIYIVEKEEYKKFADIIKYFLLKREKRDFRYYTERNSAEEYPIFEIDDKRIFIGFNRQLLVSLYVRLYNELKASKDGERFLISRDKYLEKKTAELFGHLNKTKVYRNLSENEKGEYEHDIIIKNNKSLIICECKATERKEPFRDPDKAAERIIRQFRGNAGIQKGYDQGNKLRKKILKEDIEYLYNEKKEIIIDFQKEKFNKIYCIVVTLNNFGYLATNLSLLLEKDIKDPYPLCMNVSDFEYLIVGYNYKKKDITDFLKYLDLRSELHEKFMASDELEIAGYFLVYNSFEKLIESNADKYSFQPEMSDIFSEAYFELKGIKKKYERDSKPHVEILDKDNLDEYIRKYNL